MLTLDGLAAAPRSGADYSGRLLPVNVKGG
jgi:hypothetical protein